MAVFEYKARNQEGKIVQDTIEAVSRKEAASLLRESKLQVLIVREIKKSQSFLDKMQKVPVIEKAVFCRYLSTMMKAGLPLVEAVEIIAQESKNRKMHRILVDLQYSLHSVERNAPAVVMVPEKADTPPVAAAKARKPAVK